MGKVCLIKLHLLCKAAHDKGRGNTSSVISRRSVIFHKKCVRILSKIEKTPLKIKKWR